MVKYLLYIIITHTGSSVVVLSKDPLDGTVAVVIGRVAGLPGEVEVV